ncbi:MAG TPA: SusC/RagA family TonB-linked outer membrane protein [Longimicrobiales bacterium]|nr:SusC/RagA family TonB-linked outer membrane protein [Longimicrobiales bacterium]
MYHVRSKVVHAAVFAALFLLANSNALVAQATGSIRGRIVEATTNRPLPSAQVVLVGTSHEALTNTAGDFLMVGVPAGSHTLRVEMLGYATATQQVNVTAGEPTTVNLTLEVSAVTLDQLVVTGTAGVTSRRAIGNSVTSVDAAAITDRTAITSLAELMQAKSPGVQILPNSGTLGAAQDIRIRGAASLTNTQPVVFIDGIRYNTESLGSFTPSGAGTTSYSGQATSAFNFINPNDIESIEIVKGPAAATLYGAEAANGVIQIITKKGHRGQQSMRWDIRTEMAQNEWALEIPDNYTTCTQAYIDDADANGNPVWPGCQGVAAGTIITGNPLRDDPASLRTGAVRRVALSARGGGDKYSFYFAGDLLKESGVFYNNHNDRGSLRANFTIMPNDWLDVYLTTSYARADLRLPIGDEAAQGMLLSAFRGRPGRVTTLPENAGWATTRAEQANAYNNTTASDRLTLGTTINFTPVNWFRSRLTLGMDHTSSLAQVLSPPGSVDADYAGVLSAGAVAQRVPRHYVYTMDYTGNVEQPLLTDLNSTTSFGVQAVSRRYEVLSATGTGLGAPDITLISAAASTVGGSGFSEAKSIGFFIQEQLGWKNRLFVTGAVRADDNSAFGESFDWIYYPKAQLSWVMSEEPALGGLFESAGVNSFRFRTAWGEAGQAPEPFSASQIYTVDRAVRPDGSVVSALRPSSYGNQNLVAEHGSEYEIGFDAGMFDDRLGVELTYYNKTMKDVIIATSAAGSSGFAGTFYGGTASVLTNLGETANSGFEVALFATPMRRPSFSWDANLSLATNDNELVEFGDDRTEMIVSGQSYGSVQRHREGYPIGGYWFTVPSRDENGAPIPLTPRSVELEELQYIGPSAPTHEVSFSNTFTLFRDFRVFMLLDYKGGHYLFNYKEYNRCAVQVNCERLNDPAQADAVDRPIWLATNAQGYWIEPADFTKLRDLSLTYTLPSTLAQRFRASSASITLAGHNLALWSDYSGIDPEVNGYGNRAFGRADVYPVPMLRRFSAALNFSF